MDLFGATIRRPGGEDRVDQVVAAVRQQVGYIVPDVVLREYVQAALADLQTARVASFVPLLARGRSWSGCGPARRTGRDGRGRWGHTRRRSSSCVCITAGVA